ncbi:PH domain-containing protein [Enterococcus caccae]|uniref:YokE-like PH domain-containing protein n=1 Tax=Enterococcus caccae ATCC BAA-1240 TaxID=1158612 RepID=R3TP27_9ENTE|nr:PH domain-containing protein [Enterococcus caccae]EOL43289.1 hypothetical protein UC7_02618 [Enterococcus caccae ATCC BAA-1240]EOT68311.1 hypothetical protein I580_00694 [Enterococcus caccae ATCC BAA-1240]OJG26798.1 hypothetical protein RU98_GL003185 [Enterococcus caccae]
MVNPFKKVINQINKEITNNTKSELNTQQKSNLFNQTKMYIFLQDFIEKMNPYLEVGEKIYAYLPMTTDGQNASVVGLGLLGMYHPETEEAKAYVKNFKDLRGNRILIFTNQRMIFTTIIEFLDQRTFFSYPYTTIKAITLKENKMSYFDWDTSFPPKRVALYTYTFDFESQDHIFSELLSQRDADILKRQLLEIPALQNILVTKKIYRERRFDRIVNNPVLAYRLTYYFFNVLVILILLLFALGGFLHIGPLKYVFDLSTAILVNRTIFTFLH